jgi:hypothetical protein
VILSAKELPVSASADRLVDYRWVVSLPSGKRRVEVVLELFGFSLPGSLPPASLAPFVTILADRLARATGI